MQRKKITSNLIWRFLERFGAQGVTFIVSIILARILNPDVYGSIALITVITAILQVFVDSGFCSALIQKKDADEIDFSTVFYSNVVLCIVLYVGLFFLSPFIANFYDMPELTDVIRVLGLVVVISGVKGVQIAYVSKNLLFKKFFFATLGGTILAASVGIWMAYNGYGIWALVLQNVINQAVDTIILWLTVKWKPKKVFSFSRLKTLFSFGWKMFLSSLLDTTWNELRLLIIGKQYRKDDLAYFNKGQEFPKYATAALNSSVDSILFPVMSEEQESKDKVRAMTRRSIKISSFCLWPMMIGLAVCAKPLVSILLTDRWLDCVPYLQIFCIVYAFMPIHTANLSAIKAMGRSDYFLILEIIKKIVNLALILSFMWFGVIWLAISSLIGSVFSQIINSWPNKKLLNYSYLEQLKDLSSSLALAVFMGICVYCITFIGFTNWLTLLIQVPLGVLIYVGGAWLFKFESFTYCLNIAKSFLPKKKKEVSLNEQN